MKLDVLITPSLPEYELVDSGNAQKLERYGKFLLVRPDPQALWRKKRPQVWKHADAVFDTSGKGKGQWIIGSHVSLHDKEMINQAWNVSFEDMHLKARLTPFKHTCIFPEQYPNWMWTRELIKKRVANLKQKNRTGSVKILNLFGYTGAATVAALLEGAEVTHVDGSKGAVQWAKENTALSIKNGKPAVHFILDDVRKFIAREIKRGNKYHGIIMDPPAYGHGAKRETWNIEDHFLPFVQDCLSILHPQEPLFFLINGYSAGYSALAYEEQLQDLKAKHGGLLEAGELAIKESLGHSDQADVKGSKTGQNEPNRALPAGIFARWSALE